MKTLMMTLFVLSAAIARGNEAESAYQRQAQEMKGLADVESAATSSSVFKTARETLKKSAVRASFVSRTVVPYGGQRTYNPTRTYLVIERWYSFDDYTNLIAQVSYSALPPNQKPHVEMMQLTPTP